MGSVAGRDVLGQALGEPGRVIGRPAGAAGVAVHRAATGHVPPHRSIAAAGARLVYQPRSVMSKGGLVSGLRRCASGAVSPRWMPGSRPGTTSAESAEIRRLKKENAELRQANEILRTASAFFAAELDRPATR
jgi:hypothetical protein